MNLNNFRISLILPGFDLLAHGLLVWDTAIQTLANQSAQFDFSHIQPTPMFRGVRWYSGRAEIIEFQAMGKKLGIILEQIHELDVVDFAAQPRLQVDSGYTAPGTRRAPARFWVCKGVLPAPPLPLKPAARQVNLYL